VSYDQGADAMFIEIRKGRYEISEELAENIILDLDKEGRVLGVEVLEVSKRMKKQTLKRMLKAEAPTASS
jgi:uncharacterized protein YuzE